MNKGELIEAIASANDLSKAKAESVLNSVIDTICVGGGMPRRPGIESAEIVSRSPRAFRTRSPPSGMLYLFIGGMGDPLAGADIPVPCISMPESCIVPESCAFAGAAGSSLLATVIFRSAVL